MNDKQLREAIDACRPGSEDVRSADFKDLAAQLSRAPELRAVYDRAQRADIRLGQAVDDVPARANLADRLLAQLLVAQQQTEQDRAATLVVATADAASSRATGHRMWYVALAASLLAIASGWWYLQPRDISSADVPELVAECYEKLGAQWSHLPAPHGLAVPRVIALRPHGWQDVSSLFGRDAVAYRFALSGGGQAILFAVDVKLERVPNVPPARPQPTTGDRSLAIWQSGDVAYLLVLKGDGREYHRFFKSLPGTTA